MPNLRLLMLTDVAIGPSFAEHLTSRARKLRKTALLHLPSLRELLVTQSGLLTRPVHHYFDTPSLTSLHLKENFTPAIYQPHATWKLYPLLTHLSVDTCTLHYMQLPPIAACKLLTALRLQHVSPVGHPQLIECVNSLRFLQMLAIGGCGCAQAVRYTYPSLHGYTNDAELAHADPPHHNTAPWSHAPRTIPIHPENQHTYYTRSRRDTQGGCAGCSRHGGHAGNLECLSTWPRFVLDCVSHSALRMLTLDGVEVTYWPPYTHPQALDWSDEPGELHSAMTGMMGTLQQDVNAMRTSLRFHHLEIVIAMG